MPGLHPRDLSDISAVVFFASKQNPINLKEYGRSPRRLGAALRQTTLRSGLYIPAMEDHLGL